MAKHAVGKNYGTVSAERRKEMSGLEFVRGLADGALPLNTIARTLGYDIAEAESGRVVVTAEPGEDLLNPAGTVHGVSATPIVPSEAATSRAICATSANGRPAAAAAPAIL